MQKLMTFLFLATWATVSFAQDAVNTKKPTTKQPNSKIELPPSPDGKESVQDCRNVVSVNSHLGANCYAGSKIEDGNALGGFGKSDNFPKDISNAASVARDKCYLLAQPNVPTELSVFRGMRVVLVNPTDQVKGFDASDSCLYLFQEAQKENGEWEQLESMVESDCGNSHHQVFLAQNQYWEFPVFRYDGDVNTKLRFKMTDASGNTVLLSNEFTGGISGSQFKPKSTPAGEANGR